MVAKELTLMFRAFYRISRAGAATSLVALLLVAGAAHSTGTRHVERLAQPRTAAEKAFPDAPFGVDSTITGPTSAAFKKQQREARCAQAVWPDVSMACYPKR